MDTQQKRRPPAAGNRKPAGKRPSAPPARPGRSRGGSAPRREVPRNSRPEARTAAKTPRRRRAKAPRKLSRPEVVYTPPKPFNRRKFLLQLTAVAAVVLAMTFVLSMFFKVKTVTVSGASLYSPWEVRQASGIVEGDNLLSFGKVRAGGRIIAALPYVESVRIGIKLPDTVNIEIVEAEALYAVEATDGSWWYMNSAGRVAEKADAAHVGESARILGVKLTGPKAGAQAQAAENAEEAETGASRLEAAAEILRELEKNGFAGEIATVDVTSTQAVTVWYGSRYEVQLGAASNLEYKISCMQKAISQMSRYQSGILDVSFTDFPEMVCYTPFP